MRCLLLILAVITLFYGCEEKLTERAFMGVLEAQLNRLAEEDIKNVQAGTYHEWADPVYTYKLYTGEPHIDSDAFYESLPGCSVWYTPYDNISDRTMLKKLAVEVDSGAMLRLALLADHNSEEYWDYVKKSSDLYNLNALALHWEQYKFYAVGEKEAALVEGPYYDHLEVYSELSPLAIYIWAKDYDVRATDNVATAYKRLRKAGNDPYILGYSAAGMYKIGEAEEVDKDNLCEAYFRGCDWLYDIKKDISCGE